MVSKGYQEPIAELTSFVERFWWVDIDAGTPLLPMHAGTGSELIFALSSPLHCSNNTMMRSSLPNISLVRVTKDPIQLEALSDVRFFSVRFRTGMIRHFLPKGFLQELNPIINGEYIWGDSISQLYETIVSTNDISIVVHTLEQFLLEQLASYHAASSQIDYLSSLLYYGNPTLTVQDVANRVGYSRRQLQRICARNFGISPKQYLSTVRFNRVKKQMLLSDDHQYLAQALDGGYFDQAHFIHEFERFALITPGQFIREYKNVSHFYNTSLQSSEYFASIVK